MATVETPVASTSTPIQQDEKKAPRRPRLNRNRYPKSGSPSVEDTDSRSRNSSQNSSWRQQPESQTQAQRVVAPGVEPSVASGNVVPPLPTDAGNNRPRQARRPGRRRPPADITPNNGEAEPSGTTPISNGNGAQNPKRRPPRNKAAASSDAISDDQPPRPHANARPKRGAKFNAGLTEPGVSTSASTSSKRQPTTKFKKPNHPPPNDLTSTLIHALGTAPYPDCPICFSPIHPAQPTWSCSPSIPIISPEAQDDSGQAQQYCWTTFHIKCIRSWAAKSVKDVADAWRARGEEDKKGEWRCPGCQGKREVVPNGYWCFCNSTPEPKPPRLATPHSCANPCTRVRETGCGHACPLMCHPGPCPRCQVTTEMECYCPRKKMLAFRCGLARDLSCGSICGRKLGCGKHTCEKICHEGECEPCKVRDIAKCWCGREEKEIGCGEGEEVECVVEGEASWIGRYDCGWGCNRTFDCNFHRCPKPCHPPSRTPPICPRSPTNVTHCPCGRHRISPTPSVQPGYTFPGRKACLDPIPTCNSPCPKPQLSCTHACSAKCHEGPCPPCPVTIRRPCRCGATTRDVRCSEIHKSEQVDNEMEILCDKPCMALRACGKHECRRICCPLASLATGPGRKGKQRARVGQGLDGGMGEERGGLHECDLICGKMLTCGNHRCEERDHKGVCPPCLRSSFEEMICYCGRTVLDPPVQCGTVIQCTWQCPRPAPPCGHPRTQHTCHEDPIPCPPCPYLATKKCACGKKLVGNVKCSLETEKVSCGAVCGKLLACGFHQCGKLCHGDECGTCTSVCGKSRKLCLPALHPCSQPCHAPSSCPEDEPCQSLIVLNCQCGRIRQSVQCGRSTSNLSRADQEQIKPKCTNECSIAKRNAKLADALGITSETREKTAAVVWSDELIGYAKANVKFMGVVEKAFSDFIRSEKKTQVLPHMPPDRRKFVHDLAAVYRMDAQMVDQEPHRSVQLMRRVDTRIPSTPLSVHIASQAPTPSLGKLADLRSASWRSPQPTSSTVKAGPTQRNWASSANRPAVAMPVPKATPIGGSIGTRTPTPTIAGNARPSSGAGTPSALTAEAVEAVPVPDSWEDDA